jgi:hypothetical protein
MSTVTTQPVYLPSLSSSHDCIASKLRLKNVRNPIEPLMAVKFENPLILTGAQGIWESAPVRLHLTENFTFSQIEGLISTYYMRYAE